MHNNDFCAKTFKVSMVLFLLSVLVPLMNATTPGNLLVSNLNFGSTFITYGQSTTINMVISNPAYANAGPYTANIMWCKLSMGQGGPGPCLTPQGVLANTIQATLPAQGNFISFTVNAYSYNTLQITFAGAAYNVITSAVTPSSTANIIGATNSMNPNNGFFANTIYGGWSFNGIVSDAFSNTLTLTLQTFQPSNALPFIGAMPGQPDLEFLSSGGFIAYITNFGNSTLEIVNVNPSNLLAAQSPYYNVSSVISVGSGPEALVSPPQQVSTSAPTIVGTVNYNANSISMINTAISEVMANMSLGAGTQPIAVAPVSNSVGFGMAFAEYGTDNVVIIEPGQQGFTSFNISLAGKVAGPDAMDTYFDRSGQATLWVAGKDNTASGTANIVPINLATMVVGNAISLGANTKPEGVVATPFGYVFVADYGTNAIGMINASSATPGLNGNITGTGAMSFNGPSYIIIDYKSAKLYVANHNSNTISVVDGMSRTVTSVFAANYLSTSEPDYISMSPNGALLYVSNYGANVISIIKSADDSILGIIPANEPTGVSLFSNYFYNGTAPSNVVFDINTPANQIAGNLFVTNQNGQVEYEVGTGTTNTIQVPFGSASQNSLSFMFQTQGSLNYFPSVIVKSFDIMPSFPQIHMSLILANGTTISVNKQGQNISLSGLPSAIFPMTLTANIVTFGNQMPANVYLGNTRANSFAQGFSHTYTSLPAGIQNFVFNALTNGNYMMVDPSIDLNVLSATTVQPCSGGCVHGSGGTGVYYTTTIATTTATTSIPTTTPVIQNPAYVNMTISPGGTFNFTLKNMGLELNIQSYAGSESHAQVHVTNVTNSSASAPPGFDKLIVVNISIASSANLSTNVSLSYPCSADPSSVVPYKFYNGTWNPILNFTLNSARCSISFSITKDPVVGLFQNMTAQTTTPPAPSVATTASTLLTTIAQPQSGSSSGSSLLWLIIVVIVVMIFVWYLSKGKRR